MQPEQVNQEVKMDQSQGPRRFGVILLSLFVLLFLGMAVLAAGWFAYQSNQLGSKLSALQAEYDALQSDHDALQNDYDALAAENDKSKADLDEAMNNLSTAQSDLTSATAELESLHANLEKLERYIDILYSSTYTYDLDDMGSQAEAFTEDPTLFELFSILDEVILNEGSDEEFYTAWGEFDAYVFDQIYELLK